MRDTVDSNFNIDDIDWDDVTGAVDPCDPDTLTISVPDGIDFNTTYTTSTSDFQFNFDYNPGIDVTQGDLSIHNEGDIKLGDRSLKEFMDKVEERMNILRPNPELEEQWDELKQLGEQYRKLEQELLEKNKMWETLKKS